MYESYFGFKDTPFRLSADEKFRYAHKNYLRASAYLAYALEQSEGFVMITGHPGSGKTTLIRDVISELDQSRYNVLNIVTSQLHAEELLRKVALEYGLDAENASKATLLTHINKHLSALHEQGKRSLLFLDEAQNLNHTGLEELRLLSNLQQGKHSLLQVILVGHTELRQLVLGPDMQHVQQRLVASCQIDALDQEQTQEYIIHRLKHVDWRGDPKIEDEVYQLIHLSSRGVPRNINHLMSHLLLFASLEEKHQLSDEDALTVIEELIDQQRITLAEGESFENFANRYREQRQQQVKHHAVGNASVVPLTSPEMDTWVQPQQDKAPPSKQNISKLNIRDVPDVPDVPLDVKMEPGNARVPGGHDSDWLSWRDGSGDDIDSETMPVEDDNAPKSKQPSADKKDKDAFIQFQDPADTILPNADDIWNGNLDSSDMETLFTDNRREKSPFSVDLSNGESHAGAVKGKIPADPEERWGGVWFMSNRNGPAQIGAGQGQRTIKQSNLPPTSVLKQNHNITVDENLTVPSVWVDECPEIIPTEAASTYHNPPKMRKAGIIKRSLKHILTLVSVGLIALLVIRLFPDLSNRLSFAQQRQENRIEATPQSATARPVPLETQDSNPPPSIPPSNDKKEVGSREPVASSVTQQSDEGVTEREEIAYQPQPLQKIKPLQTPTQTDQTPPTQADVAAPVDADRAPLNESEIESYHHIDLATRYFVYFDFNDFSVPEEHKALLKSVRDKMLLEENNYLNITGYADSQGNVNYNRRLSLKRAEAVKEFFTLRGIPDERLRVSAVGAISNGDPKFESIDKRRLIRRVEVILFPTKQ
jgi:type II secretory pathway predicted ATPase ExeA/outer membrane protein OmpA-like peptidoglycan-associated protein